MKKLIIFSAVLVLVTGLCFAQAEEAWAEETTQAQTHEQSHPLIERFDLEISAGFPIHWNSATHDQSFYWYNPTYDMEDKTITANTSFGLAMIFNFTKKIGFNLDTDVFLSSKTAVFANPSSNNMSMFGANILMGPVFYLHNSSSLRIPLTIGGHLYYFSDDLWMPNFVGYDPSNPPATIQSTNGFWLNRRDLQVGPGISLGLQFHFTPSIYIFSRTSFVVDIYGWHEIKYIADDGTGTGTYIAQTKSETSFITSWGVKPVLGLGIKF